MIEILSKLGLSDRESAVYLALLELGAVSVQNIAHKAKVNRTTTYVILERLLRLGIVSTVEMGKKTLYRAENPQELSKLIDLDRQEIKQKEQYLTGAMDRLQAIYNLRDDKPTVRFYEGREGLIAMHRYAHRIIPVNGQRYAYIDLDVLNDSYNDIANNLTQERVKLGIEIEIIANTRSNNPIFNADEHNLLRQTIVVPRTVMDITVNTYITPGFSVEYYCLRTDEPHGIFIQSALIADQLTSQFLMHWEQLSIAKT
ncbi:MAG: transcriptional regulator TrmB [Candidatus Berkelbacteria bacterium Gr01-1014_85]|uniref:Transcriptional regulator TrmB n=1 Tax=Candidatus Berkelbacteria bacterium Gr01-1014_85 TaxID=2017150 RepID=A0A554JBT6_9BACT|nr:MAG: transcriptional regulator TrmB [Candidatus Berkelbacteria bacterium Gr01-1014_85]